MEPAYFICERCGTAVPAAADSPGGPVRCTQCQHAMQRPTAGPVELLCTAEAADDIEFVISPPTEEDSIFTAPRPASEDLFGETVERPAIILPPEAEWVGGPGEASSTPANATPTEAPRQPKRVGDAIEGGFPGTAPFDEPLDFERLAAPHPNSPPQGGRDQTAPAPRGGWEQTALLSAVDSLPVLSPIRNGLPAERPKLLSTFALIFLIPYSLLATGAAIYYYIQWRQTPHPLELLPDWPGDTPGAIRKPRPAKVLQRIAPDSDLPRRLHVVLGKTVAVGQLEVTPEKIERRGLVFIAPVKGSQPETSREEALVLTLRLRNLTPDVSFVPMDPAFNQRWQEGQPKPYTFLEIGPHRFYGGPLDWKPGKGTGGTARPAREHILRAEDEDKALGPGEDRAAIICTDPRNTAIIPVVSAYPGTMTWRVRLRRGLASVGDREVSASAVVGVDFVAKDIRESKQ